VEETLSLGNVYDLVLGFGLGAITFSIAEHLIKHGNFTDENGKKINKPGSEGKLAVIGTILDSVPETLFIGILIALREPGLVAAIVVLFMGNLATTLEAAKIMHFHGIPKRKILRDWLADFVIVAVAAPIGYFLAQAALQDVLAIVLGFAAGTLIVFISGELIARAYRESTGHLEDLSISLGFLVGVILLFVI
jgi:zinc transporter, ZIP family